MELGIKGKVALVTGGARGIGLAICEALAAEGAAVAVNDLNAEAAERAAAGLRERGAKAVAAPGDVTDYAATVAMTQSVERALGPIDILVNNAGLWIIKPFVESTPADWAREVNLNLYGVIHASHAVVAGMTARGSGVIISITSEAARVGEPRLAVYSGAKAGVIGFTKGLAKELARAGVRVNAIAMGTTRTPQAEATFKPEHWGKIVKAYPLGRTGEPSDAADAVLFLASARSSWVTGQTLGVNGGYAMP